jgi:hypothetical protein
LLSFAEQICRFVVPEAVEGSEPVEEVLLRRRDAGVVKGHMSDPGTLASGEGIGAGGMREGSREDQ